MSLVVALVALVRPPSAEAADLTGIQVFFSANDGSGFKAYTRALPGSDERVTSTGAGVSESSPSPSPDGRRVALVLGGQGRATSEVAVFERGASAPLWRRTVPGLQSVRWSPDGTTLAITDARDLLTLPADGSDEPTALIQNTSVGIPSWSPDSARISYSDGTDLLMITVATKAFSYLIENSSSPITQTQSWSPDGASLLYLTRPDQTVHRFYFDHRPLSSAAGRPASFMAPQMHGDWYAAVETGTGYLEFANTSTGQLVRMGDGGLQPFELTGWIGDVGPGDNANQVPRLQAPEGNGFILGDRSQELTLTLPGMTDLDGRVTATEVDWGDGTIETMSVPDYTEDSTSQTLKHKYSTFGDHTVRVAAIDDDGGRSAARTVTARVVALDARSSAAPGTPDDETWLDVDVSGTQFVGQPLTYTVNTGVDQTTGSGPILRVKAPGASGHLDLSATTRVPGNGDEVTAGTARFDYDVNANSPPPQNVPSGGLLVEGARGTYGTDLRVYDSTKAGAGPTLIRKFDVNGPLYGFRWDETGTRITYLSIEPEPRQIFMINRTGGNPVQLTHETRRIISNGDLYGNLLVYSVGAPEDPSSEIKILDLSTGTVRTVVSVGGVDQPSNVEWSPNGSHILYALQGPKSQGAWTINADGTHNSQVFKPSGLLYPSAASLRWTPDGRHFVGTVTKILQSGRAQSRPALISSEYPDLPRLFRSGDDKSWGNTVIGPGGARWASQAQGSQPDGIYLGATSGASPATYFGPGGQVWDWMPTDHQNSGGGPQIAVTSTDDPAPNANPDPGCNPAPGNCTLHEAIDTINDSNTGTAVIDLPDGSTPIKLNRPLPPITRPVILVGGGTLGDLLGDDGADDGDSGASGGAVGTGNSDGCAQAPVIIDGSRLGPGTHGVVIHTGRSASRSSILHRVVLTGFSGDGIHVVDSAHVRMSCASATNNGGAGLSVHDSVDVSAIGENSFAFNRGDGVRVTGASRRVRAWAGRITANAGLAIDLGDDGVTANDTTSGDADTGPNGLVNQPTIVRIEDDPNSNDPTRKRVLVRVNHNTSSGPFRIDVYRNGACDESQHGELAQWMAGARVDLSTSTSRVVRIPFLDGGYGPMSATVTTDAGTSEASVCAFGPDGDESPVADPVVDPISVVWPDPGSDTPVGVVGGSTSKDPTTGSGAGGPGGGTWGGDIPGSDTTTSDTGQSVGGDPSGGSDTTSSQPAPVFDVDPYVVVGTAGKVTVDPPPGPLMGVHGGLGPYTVVPDDGGTIPKDAWSVQPQTGLITLDATAIASDGYFGLFHVVDAAGNSTPSEPIYFLVRPTSSATYSPKLVASDDALTLAPGAQTTFTGDDNLLRNDTYLGSPRAAITAVNPSAGSLPLSRVNLKANGDVSVDARGLAEGTYTFTYRARGGGLTSAPATVHVRVDNYNTCATAVNDHYDLVAGSVLDVPAALGALANDQDPEGQQLTAKLVGSFQAKDISFSNDGAIHLDATKASPGTFRQFQYQAVDPAGELCAPATVRLDIAANRAPTANGNFYTVAAGRTFTLPTRGVLGDDLDPDGPDAALTSVIDRTITGLTLGRDGSLSYTAPKRLGVYEASYRAKDGWGGTSAPAAIRFRVVEPAQAPPPDHPPVAAEDTFYRVHADQLLSVSPADGVLANDKDSDGDALYALPSDTSAKTRFPLLRDGSFTFKPTRADIGKTLNFTYRAIELGDKAAASATKTVSITVLAPRTRCRSVQVGLATNGVDSDGDVDNLANASGGFAWCHNTIAITRAGLAAPGGGFATGSLTAPGFASGTITAAQSPATNEALLFAQLQATTANRQNVRLYNGAANAQYFLGPQYQMCVNPYDIALDLAGVFAKVPGGEKLVAYVDDLPELVRLMWKAVNNPVFKALDKFVGIINKLSSIAPLLGLVPGDDDHTQAIEKLVTFGVNQTVKRRPGATETADPVPPTGPPRPAVTINMAKAVALVLQQGDQAGLLDEFKCIPLSAVWSGFDDAQAGYIARVQPRDGFVPGDVASFDHLFVFVSKWVHGFSHVVGDPGGLLDSVSVQWPATETTSQVAIVSCDLTRTRPNQVNPAPDVFPGVPKPSC